MEISGYIYIIYWGIQNQNQNNIIEIHNYMVIHSPIQKYSTKRNSIGKVCINKLITINPYASNFSGGLEFTMFNNFTINR